MDDGKADGLNDATTPRPPVRFTAALAAEICARVAAGESLQALAGRPGMPSRRTFRDWSLRHPAFARDLANAQAARSRAVIAADDARIETLAWRRLMRMRGTRRSTFTPELGEAICERVAAGESVLSIAADPQMPCAVTIYNWARREPGFREAYARAKSICADVLFDLAREVALESREGTVKSDRLRVQTLHRQAALLAPRKYGPAALADQDRDEEGRFQPFNVIVQHFGEPEEGPQFTDMDGNEVPRPDWA